MNLMQTMIVKGMLLGWLVVAAALPAFAQPATAQRAYETPELALQAIIAATKADDENLLVQILGAQYRDLVVTTDKTQDREGRARFARAAAEYQLLRRESDGRVTLLVGAEAWPFPIPLVKSNAGWRFDTAAGEEEIINRRIGRNELSAIEALRVYVDAQRLYAAKPRDNTKVRQFAQNLGSSPGKKDGLYWDADPSKGEELSPFGPLIKDAASRQTGKPYNGYFYKILKSQGPAAPAGNYSYVINGRMIAGYALIAYPADYGSSGVKTFIVNHYGDVYEKDLGANTAQQAAAISAYNPDASWKVVAD